MTELDESINAPPLSPVVLPPMPSRFTSLRQLLVLAAPVLAEHVLHMAVGWNDTYLANHLSDHQADAGAAVGTIQYIFWFLGLFAAAIGVGSTALIARATGSRTRRTVNSVCGQSILFAVSLGIILGALLFIFASPIANLTRLQGPAHDFALQYLRVLSPSVPFLIVMFVASACLRGAGDTLTPGIAMIVVDLVNIAFSWGLTRGLWGMPRMGFAGIAIGTVIAYIAGGLLQFGVLWFGRGKIKLHLHRLRPHWVDMKRILRIGLPNGIGDTLNFIANFVLVMVINQTDPTSNSSAAHNIAIRVESLSYMSGFAIAVAATTLVGQALGEKNPRKAERSAYFAFFVGGGFMALMGIAFIFLGRYPVGLLADEPTVRHLATRCLFITGFCQAGFAAAIIFGGALRGAGDTISVMFLQLASILVIRLGGVLIVGLWLRMGLAAIWVVLAGELVVRGALIYGRFLNGGWKRVQV
jgi:putative MATE family efflux protein